MLCLCAATKKEFKFHPDPYFRLDRREPNVNTTFAHSLSSQMTNVSTLAVGLFNVIFCFVLKDGIHAMVVQFRTDCGSLLPFVYFNHGLNNLKALPSRSCILYFIINLTYFILKIISILMLTNVVTFAWRDAIT